LRHLRSDVLSRPELGVQHETITLREASPRLADAAVYERPREWLATPLAG